ncbi:MAG: AAA family ATPase [Betaproteobacteria bacterium]
MTTDGDWKIFTGSRKPGTRILDLPAPPSWRPQKAPVLVERQLPWTKKLGDGPAVEGTERAISFHATPAIVEIVNAALYLRRPLLVTGKPGSGKSSLVEAVAWELGLGAPLRWAVTSRSTLRDALYQYDAIGRLQDDPRDVQAPARDAAAKATSVGRFVTLGALGTSLLPTHRPRALLIDEIDKSDIDLPNDLLNVFEEGEFEIPELRRFGTDLDVEVLTSDKGQPRVTVHGGLVQCHQFPFMVLTSNGEREFPAPFLRRCLRLEMPNPTGNRPEDDNEDGKRLKEIVRLHFKDKAAELASANRVIEQFIDIAINKGRDVATDQLLNAVYFVLDKHQKPVEERERVLQQLMRELVETRP